MSLNNIPTHPYPTSTDGANSEQRKTLTEKRGFEDSTGRVAKAKTARAVEGPEAGPEDRRKVQAQC